jgi:predicted small lipoprotein YifL
MATISTMTWQILGKRTILLFLMALGLAACGQKGALFIPTDPEARERGMFPQVLMPDTRPDTPTPTPAQP